ncbi:hypothetical protein D3C87_1691600 [compost metagenome]
MGGEEAEELMEGALVLVDPPGGLESEDFKGHRPGRLSRPCLGGGFEVATGAVHQRAHTVMPCDEGRPKGMAWQPWQHGFAAVQLISSLIKLCRVCPDACASSPLS